MSVAVVTVDVAVAAAAVAMALNGARWYLRGAAAWYELRELLAESGEDPSWQPVQPALGIGLRLLVRGARTAGVPERERVDVEGRVAIARAWLWFGAGVATFALLILGQHLGG